MFADSLSRFSAVDLTTMTQAAPPQVRRDRKYLLTVGQADDLLATLADEGAALEIDGTREFGYESTYYDTSDLVSFQSAATRRRRRFKVRTRLYRATGERWLEVKTRGARGLTLKDRTPLPGSWDEGWLDATLAARGVHQARSRQLAPVLTVKYLRSTLLFAHAARATIDTALAWSLYPIPGARLVPGLVVMETKTASGACVADRWAWRRGVRPARISKYATGMALLDPRLESNRWRRTLNLLSEMENRDEDPAKTRPRPRRILDCDDPVGMFGGLAVGS